MSLSARRVMRRPVRARTVGLPTRLCSALVDSLLPSLALVALVWAGALDLDAYQGAPGIFAFDRILMRLYENPRSLLYLPVTWMLLWTAFSMATLGTVRTTLGKKITRLTILDSSGHVVSGSRLLLRIMAGWLVPATLGLAFLWIVVSPERRGWHDLLSGTFVVRAQSNLAAEASDDDFAKRSNLHRWH